MAIVIVRGETTINQLKSRIVAGRVSAARFNRVKEAVGVANPGVDLDRLVPGTVLTIPEVEEVATRGDTTAEGVLGESADAVVGEVDKILERLFSSLVERAEESRAEREEVGAALASPPVRAAARKDPELATAVSAVREALKADEGESESRVARTEAAIGEWTEDLAHVRSLLGD